MQQNQLEGEEDGRGLVIGEVIIIDQVLKENIVKKTVRENQTRKLRKNTICNNFIFNEAFF